MYVKAAQSKPQQSILSQWISNGRVPYRFRFTVAVAVTVVAAVVVVEPGGSNNSPSTKLGDEVSSLDDCCTAANPGALLIVWEDEAVISIL